jgi:hypothetical protein
MAGYGGWPSVAAVSLHFRGLRSVCWGLAKVSRVRDCRDPGERGGELVGPRLGGRDAQPTAALAAIQAGGGVQQAIAQPFRFRGGEAAVEGADLQQGDEIAGRAPAKSLSEAK